MRVLHPQLCRHTLHMVPRVSKSAVPVNNTLEMHFRVQISLERVLRVVCTIEKNLYCRKKYSTEFVPCCPLEVALD